MKLNTIIYYAYLLAQSFHSNPFFFQTKIRDGTRSGTYNIIHVVFTSKFNNILISTIIKF